MTIDIQHEQIITSINVQFIDALFCKYMQYYIRREFVATQHTLTCLCHGLVQLYQTMSVL